VLVIVADAQGLSYYSEATLSRLLKLEPLQLARARQQLIAGDLLAYQKPLYQVLELPPASTPASTQRSGQALSVGDILRQGNAKYGAPEVCPLGSYFIYPDEPPGTIRRRG
jgi:hypothetical protein